MKLYGHRGAGEGPDENTLASCRRALKQGADGIELDVQLIGGELWLAHPPHKPQETLPHLLDGLPRQTKLILHLKRRRFSPRHDRHAIRKMAPLLAKRDAVISSFFPGTISHLKRHYPRLKRGFNTAWPWYDLLFSQRLSPDMYVARHWLLGGRTMRRAQRRRMPVVVYVSRRRVPARLLSLGLAGVMTDDVPAWVAATRARGRGASPVRGR